MHRRNLDTFQIVIPAEDDTPITHAQTVLAFRSTELYDIAAWLVGGKSLEFLYDAVSHGRG